MDLPEQQLSQWKQGLMAKILELEAKIRPLMTELAELREKQAAVERLLGTNSNGSDAEGARTSPSSRSVTRRTLAPIGGDSFAPTHAYWNPILESLVELGGRSEADSVLNRVQQKMKDVLTEADFEVLPSGVSVRWKNRVQWQRKNMVDQGLLRNDSPRGIWEITEDGKEWLGINRKS